MTSPQRLLEEGTEFEREVLASARLDVGRDRGLKRTLAALGVGAATFSAAASTASAGATVGAASGAAAGVAAGAGVGLLAKSIAVGVLVVAGAATTFSMTSRTRQIPAPVAHTAVVAEPGPTQPSTPVALPPSPPTVTPADTMPVLEQRVVLKGPSKPAPAPSTRQPSALEGEVAALDQVRAALAQGDARAASAELDAYERAFPASVLGDEATVLRIDALTLQGNEAGAAALSRRFLAAHPSSPHAPHLQLVIGAVTDDSHNP